MQVSVLLPSSTLLFLPPESVLVNVLALSELSCSHYSSALRNGLVPGFLWKLSFPIYSKVLKSNVVCRAAFWCLCDLSWELLKSEHLGILCSSSTVVSDDAQHAISPLRGLKLQPGHRMILPRYQEQRGEKSNIIILATMHLFCWLVAASCVHEVCFWKWTWDGLFVS